ncbi:LOW QUALITY PROTEIN: hypothetical protein MXB_5362 [Myxobolus squamalis]|nr:LOW QUALITY PROTEIN: hypothetical protein MXB_5362 [Myxobolus squamalis]
MTLLLEQKYDLFTNLRIETRPGRLHFVNQTSIFTYSITSDENLTSATKFEIVGTTINVMNLIFLLKMSVYFLRPVISEENST